MDSHSLPAETAADTAARVERQTEDIVSVVTMLAVRGPEEASQAVAELVYRLSETDPPPSAPARPAAVLRAVASALNIGAAIRESGS